MIKYLLYSVPRDNKFNNNRKKQFYVYIASLLIIIASALAFYLNQDTYTIITGTFGALGLIVVLISSEKYNKKLETIKVDYQDYNKELNNLRNLLNGATYDLSDFRSESLNDNQETSVSVLNWYTKDKLKYLIECFDELIFEKNKYDNPSISLLKNTSVPVISFAGGVIAEKAELAISLKIALIVLLIIWIFWSLVQIFSFFDEQIFFSTSYYQKKRIRSLLSDLYIRDFDESAAASNALYLSND